MWTHTFEYIFKKNSKLSCLRDRSGKQRHVRSNVSILRSTRQSIHHPSRIIYVQGDSSRGSHRTIRCEREREREREREEHACAEVLRSSSGSTRERNASGVSYTVPRS